MITIDDSYTLTNDVYRGRKPKRGFIKNGKKYIFKYSSLNNEIYAELIAEQLGIQAGINMAHYQYAIWDGNIGVLTDNFINSDELIISSDMLRRTIQDTFEENNIDYNIKDNSVSSILEAAWTYDNSINPQELSDELMKRWAFAGLILESDKNASNISFLRGPDGLKLSPDYDNSSMCLLNKNISLFMERMKYGIDIYNFTDATTNQLNLSGYSSKLTFLEEFRIFVLKYPECCDKIMESFKSIDVTDAIKKVEDINDISIPYDVKFWVTKVVNTRLADMQSIYKLSKKQK